MKLKSFKELCEKGTEMNFTALKSIVNDGE